MCVFKYECTHSNAHALVHVYVHACTCESGSSYITNVNKYTYKCTQYVHIILGHICWLGDDPPHAKIQQDMDDPISISCQALAELSIYNIQHRCIAVYLCMQSNITNMSIYVWEESKMVLPWITDVLPSRFASYTFFWNIQNAINNTIHLCKRNAAPSKYTGLAQQAAPGTAMRVGPKGGATHVGVILEGEALHLPPGRSAPTCHRAWVLAWNPTAVGLQWCVSICQEMWHEKPKTSVNIKTFNPDSAKKKKTCCAVRKLVVLANLIPSLLLSSLVDGGVLINRCWTNEQET